MSGMGKILVLGGQAMVLMGEYRKKQNGRAGHTLEKEC